MMAFRLPILCLQMRWVLSSQEMNLTIDIDRRSLCKMSRNSASAQLKLFRISIDLRKDA